MNLPATSLKRFVLLWAFAILWFYIGSLINFHQHHIWGKNLIPQISSCSRNKSKTAPGLGNDETVGFYLPTHTIISDKLSSVGFSFLEPSFIVTCLNTIHAHPFILDEDGFAFSQLRGPPQA